MDAEEVAEIGLVACPRGCHGVGLQVDMEFLYAFYIFCKVLVTENDVTTFLVSEK